MFPLPYGLGFHFWPLTKQTSAPSVLLSFWGSWPTYDIPAYRFFFEHRRCALGTQRRLSLWYLCRHNSQDHPPYPAKKQAHIRLFLGDRFLHYKPLGTLNRKGPLFLLPRIFRDLFMGKDAPFLPNLLFGGRFPYTPGHARAPRFVHSSTYLRFRGICRLNQWSLLLLLSTRCCGKPLNPKP